MIWLAFLPLIALIPVGAYMHHRFCEDNDYDAW